MIRAVNEGVPVVSSRPGTPVAQAVQRVAQAIVGIPTDAGNGAREQRKKGLFRR
jgi:MinD-like ATPase involved in chromosome partitioning or flagellar assembly